MKKTITLILALCMAAVFCARGSSAPKETAAAQTETQAASKGETAAAETTENTTTEETTESEPVEKTITDMIGREVIITPGSYSRVVCIGAGALRMYSYIGDAALLCGVEDIDNETLADRPQMFDSVARPYVIAYGDTFSTLPSCGVGGPMAQTAEAEKILSCDPDIVISEYEDVEKEDALQEQLGVPVVTLKAGPAGVFDDSFMDTMEMLGKIFGNDEKADRLISYIQAEAGEITKRTAGVKDEDKPGVYICGLGNWGTTNQYMTAQNYISFNIANVRNVVTDLATDGIQEIEAEKFVALGGDMDIMIMDAAAVKNIKPLYAEDPSLFDACKAWRDGQVYLEMAYNAYYTNYEIALINTWFIAKSVYPDLFEDVDMAVKTDEVCEVFYGRKMADEIFAAPFSFGGYQKIDTAIFLN